MNPVLLKPESDHRSQVVLLGRPWVTVKAREYYGLKDRLWTEVAAALGRLRAGYDVVVIEGAGGAAEINLARDEIVNMRVARHFGAPVLLVGDIDRGGVFASLLGTMELLEPAERELVKALLINKFRGDRSLLDPGLAVLEERTGVPVAGVLPWIEDLRVAEEDSLGLPPVSRPPEPGLLDIAVVRLPHMSNFDDFDPLLEEGGIGLRYAASAEQLGEPDAVILPGCKTTIADLLWLRRQGLAEAILEAHRRGAFLIGICGGYQMLGRAIVDEDRVESPCPQAEGLGLLPLSTTFHRVKQTRQVAGEVTEETGLLAGARGAPIRGYEIHQGACAGHPPRVPFRLTRVGREEASRPEGGLDAEGRVLGTFVHGLFDGDRLRQALLANMARARGKRPPGGVPRRSAELEYDRIAAVLRRHMDVDLVYRIAGLERGR
jgi:adenosylcobyric acid synthase